MIILHISLGLSIVPMVWTENFSWPRMAAVTQVIQLIQYVKKMRGGSIVKQYIRGLSSGQQNSPPPLQNSSLFCVLQILPCPFFFLWGEWPENISLQSIKPDVIIKSYGIFHVNEIEYYRGRFSFISCFLIIYYIRLQDLIVG